jgi:hypothetical protein
MAFNAMENYIVAFIHIKKKFLAVKNITILELKATMQLRQVLNRLL